jgi:hypothetical protein
MTFLLSYHLAVGSDRFLRPPSLDFLLNPEGLDTFLITTSLQTRLDPLLEVCDWSYLKTPLEFYRNFIIASREVSPTAPCISGPWYQHVWPSHL